MSRQNDTKPRLVGEMRVGKLKVGKMRMYPIHTGRSVARLQFHVCLKEKICKLTPNILQLYHLFHSSCTVLF